jgi:hypothetical protein
VVLLDQWVSILGEQAEHQRLDRATLAQDVHQARAVRRCQALQVDAEFFTGRADSRFREPALVR